MDKFIEKLNAVALNMNVGLKYYYNLSEGEKHRINIVVDQFTSFLDRKTAKKVAKGINDYVYNNFKFFYDVVIEMIL